MPRNQFTYTGSTLSWLSSPVPTVPVINVDYDTPASALASLDGGWKMGRATPFGMTYNYDQYFDGRTTGPFDLWQPKPALNITFMNPNGVVFGLLSNKDDTAVGTNANDYLYGGAGKDFIHGNGGDDFITGDQGEDRLFGGAGVDYIWGGADNDRIYGGSGDDWLFGDGGDDRLYGGSGNDTFDFSGGKDIFFGGEGTDTVDFKNAGLRVEVSLIWDRATFSSIENLIGGDNDTFFTGNNADNALVGGTGTAELRGLGGNDRLLLGDGRAWGGDGDDYFFFRSMDGTAVNMFGEDGDDKFNLETISANTIFAYVEGGEGFDQIILGGYQSIWTLQDGVNAQGEATHEIIDSTGKKFGSFWGVEQVLFSGDGTTLDF